MDILFERINDYDFDSLYGDGTSAPEISETVFDDWLQNHPNTFVKFYTPWCHWCQELEPIWEYTAEMTHKEGLPIHLIKVNCDQNKQLCDKHKIRAFPTLRFYRHSVAVSPDYQEHRTIEDLMIYIRKILEIPPKTVLETKGSNDFGCQIQGNLLLNRVPGNFRIEARSWTQVVNPFMMNISHVINHLSFGPLLTSSELKEVNAISEDYFLYSSLHPMDNHSFIVQELHRGYHHFVEVLSLSLSSLLSCVLSPFLWTHSDCCGEQAVPTTLELPSRKTPDEDQQSNSEILTHQLIQASQLMAYHEELIPAIVVSYDISPLSVHIRQRSKPWYAFVTSLCAIIGGTVTVLGILARTLITILQPPRPL